MNARHIAVVGLVILLAASMVGPIAAQDADPDAGGDYTIDELRQDGKHYSVPSARIVPEEQRVYWLEHTPANQPWREVTKENNGPKFDEGSVLQTNTIYLRTIRAQTDAQTLNVTVVSWNPDTKTVKEGNVTTEERYAANVSVMTKQVTIGPGWGMAEVNLPSHPDGSHITMWVDGYEDTARWTFQHKSVATTQPMNIDTWGEFLFKLMQYVGLTVLIGGALAGRKIRSAVESAAIGPQWGFGKWAVTITILTAVLAYGAYAALAQVIVYVPYLIGVWIVGIFAAYTLATHRGEIHKKGLLKPNLTDAVSYTDVRLDADEDSGVKTDGGENVQGFGHDILNGEFATFLAVHDEEGLSIVKPGFMQFLARVYGARARIENLQELKARFELPNSSPDEIFFVDPDADELIEYEPPGFEFDFPKLSRAQTVAVGAGAIGALYGITEMAAQFGNLVYAGAGLVGAWAVWRFFVKATDGYAHIDPAPMHFRQAFASTLMLSKGVAGARDLDEARRQARVEKLRTRKEAQDELDESDRVMLDFFSGTEVDDDVPDPVEDYDHPPKENDDEDDGMEGKIA